MEYIVILIYYFLYYLKYFLFSFWTKYAFHTFANVAGLNKTEQTS